MRPASFTPAQQAALRWYSYAPAYRPMLWQFGDTPRRPSGNTSEALLRRGLIAEGPGALPWSATLTPAGAHVLAQFQRPA